jgi:hypothetical protein
VNTPVEVPEDDELAAHSGNGHLPPQPSIEITDPKELPPTPHQRSRSFGQNQAVPPSTPGGSDTGTATISVVSASGYGADLKLEVHVQQDSPTKGFRDLIRTDHHRAKDGVVKFEGTKKVQCSADTRFKVLVLAHKTFGSDKLGENIFFVNDQASGGEQDIQVGEGTVTLRTSFQPAEPEERTSLTAESPASSRKEGKGGLGRFVSRRERSVTPSG